MTGFTYGPFTTRNAQASVEIKSLECEHRPIIITRNDCDAIKFLNSRRLRFYMNYVDNIDCFVEIWFPGKVNLKLSISNFKVSKITKKIVSNIVLTFIR